MIGLGWATLYTTIIEKYDTESNIKTNTESNIKTNSQSSNNVNH